MSKASKSIIWSARILIIAILLIVLGVLVNHKTCDVLYTVGISLFAACVVYIVLYLIELEKEFLSTIVNILYEYVMLSDYLTDYIYDIQFMKKKEEALKRIIQLYEEIHKFKVTGVTLEIVQLRGKYKKTIEIYQESTQRYVEMLDYIVQARNKAIELLFDIKKATSKERKDEESTELIKGVEEKARMYSTIYLKVCDEVKTSLGLEYNASTKYKTEI